MAGGAVQDVLPECTWKARLCSNCELCRREIEVGAPMWPIEVPGARGLRWVHFDCAVATGLTAQKQPTCKHFRRGKCVYGDACAFLHERDDGAGASAEPRKRTCGGKRNMVRNDFRASVLRRFLLDEFGLDTLRAGRGVLDIAGGGGELAFELLNLNNVPAVCVDPRPPRTEKSILKWSRGLYWWNPIWLPWNGRRPPEGTPPRSPKHFRLLFGKGLTDWAASLVGAGEGTEHAVTLDQLAWLRRELAFAARLSWTRLGLHEGDSAEPSSCPGNPRTAGAEPDGGANEDDAVAAVCEEASNGGSHPWPAAPPLLLDNQPASLQPNGAGSPPLGHNRIDLAADAEGGCGSSAAATTTEEARNEALDIAQTISQCSAVVGLHPDQAAGHVVDFAIAARKPFVVVPCCVYFNSFTKRKLADGTMVRSYEQLLKYLESRGPGIRRRTLDFEGKNVALYWSPTWGDAEAAGAGADWDDSADLCQPCSLDSESTEASGNAHHPKNKSQPKC